MAIHERTSQIVRLCQRVRCLRRRTHALTKRLGCTFQATQRMLPSLRGRGRRLLGRITGRGHRLRRLSKGFRDRHSQLLKIIGIRGRGLGATQRQGRQCRSRSVRRMQRQIGTRSRTILRGRVLRRRLAVLATHFSSVGDRCGLLGRRTIDTFRHFHGKGGTRLGALRLHTVRHGRTVHGRFSGVLGRMERRRIKGLALLHRRARGGGRNVCRLGVRQRGYLRQALCRRRLRTYQARHTTLRGRGRRRELGRGRTRRRVRLIHHQ